VIKQVNNDMATDADIALRVNNYLDLPTPYNGETTVLHYLEVLRDRVGFDKLRAAVTNPLKGHKIAAYYGCLLLRPSKIMQFDDAENPTILEDFIRAIGAEPVSWGMRNECCGGYIAAEDKAQATKRSGTVMEDAAKNGADTVITACPLCLYNLKKNGGHDDLPVVYFTALLAEALGVK
jgi:heterodisulfide reductase subunit B